MNVQDQQIPLYGRIAEKYNQLPATEARQSAFHKFQLLGFPSIRNEDWKYTNITRFLKDEYALKLPQNATAPATLLEAATIPDFDAYRIVLVNGVWQKEPGQSLPKGVELLSVAEAKQDPALAQWFEKPA